MKRYYCNGKKGYCDRGNDNNIDCNNCEFANGTGGYIVDIPDTVYGKIKCMSIEELADWLYANCEWLSAEYGACSGAKDYLHLLEFLNSADEYLGGDTLDNIQKCEFMEDEIYPLTIVCDRYTGSYSGGEYTAWNLDFYEIPMDIALRDVCCMEFWDNEENQKKYVVGKGRTASEALADLYIKLKGGANG